MVDGPLSGLLVVDLTRVLAGPYCTMVLADMGARVIKVETPGTGDDSRHIGPFIEDKSAYFMSLNRGKESIALDLKADGDRAIFEDAQKEILAVSTCNGSHYGFSRRDFISLRVRRFRRNLTAISKIIFSE